MNRVVRIKDISSSIGSGITPLRSNDKYWNNGTIPWLKTGELGEHKIFDTNEKITTFALENTGLKIFPVNTLSIALYGEGKTRGKVSILKKEMTTNQACCNVVIDKTKADYNFVYYLLKTKYNQLRNLSSGIRKNLNADYIKELEILLPDDISVQQKIASVLSALDNKIELNNQINSELEKTAKTIYDYWFVQFDFPDENGRPYKSNGGKMVWNEELKREIPEGWESIKIGTILSKNNKKKKIPKSKIQLDGKIPIIDQSTEFIAGFTNDIDSIIESATPKIIFGDHTRILKFINFDFAQGADGTQLLFSKNNRMPQHLLYQALNQIDLSNYGYARHFKFLKEFNIVLPNENIAIRYDLIAKNFYDIIKVNIFQNLELSKLRDWLLPMLMNGQVKVMI